MGTRAEGLRPLLLGISIGAMTVASLLGLLKPALEEGSLASVALGLAAGVLLLVGAGALLGERDVRIGELRGGNVRLSVLVFGVLFVHSLPEGLAIGTAYASDRAGLSLFVMLAIAVQNIPEGTAIALPMQAAGFSRRRQFWAAVLTSTPQPVGAVVAFLVVEHVSGLLAASFASPRARCSRSSPSSSSPRSLGGTFAARLPGRLQGRRSCSPSPLRSASRKATTALRKARSSSAARP
jgi:zinc transporter, ZIP family